MQRKQAEHKYSLCCRKFLASLRFLTAAGKVVKDRCLGDIWVIWVIPYSSEQSQVKGGLEKRCKKSPAHPRRLAYMRREKSSE